jgi:hypothetical protein
MSEAGLQPGSQEKSAPPSASGEREPSAATAPTTPPLSGRIELGQYTGNRLLSLFFDTRGPVWKYIIRAGLISLLPSLLVAFLLAAAGIDNAETMPQFSRDAGAVLLFVILVIVSPVVETVFLGVGLWLLSFVTQRPLRQALLSCVVWAVMHSLAVWVWQWGLTIIWPFFVFSCAYLAWRQKSRWHALGVACGIHMFQNLLPGIVVALM